MDLSSDEISEKSSMEVTNILASSRLQNDIQIRLDKFKVFCEEQELIKSVEVRNKETPYGLYLEPYEGTNIYVHKGSVVLKGVDKLSEIETAQKTINTILNNAGLNQELEIKIRNIVAKDDLGTKLRLPEVSLILNNDQYLPEDYPAISYETEIGTTIQIYESGVIQIAGCQSLYEAHESSRIIRRKLNEEIEKGR